MVAANDCLPQVNIVRMRVTTLDSNYEPQAGTGKMYVTDSMIRVGWSPVYTDGNEVEQKNGAGSVCNAYKSADSLKRLNLTIELCSPNPQLLAMLLGTATLDDNFAAFGRPLGWAMQPIGTVPAVNTSVEWWVVRNNAGVADATFPYEWYAAPLTNNWRMGDRDHAEGAQNITVTGQAYENPNWLDGPTQTWPLTVPTTRTVQHIPARSVEIPAASCAALTVAAS